MLPYYPQQSRRRGPANTWQMSSKVSSSSPPPTSWSAPLWRSARRGRSRPPSSISYSNYSTTVMCHASHCKCCANWMPFVNIFDCLVGNSQKRKQLCSYSYISFSRVFSILKNCVFLEGWKGEPRKQNLLDILEAKYSGCQKNCDLCSRLNSIQGPKKL